MKIAQGIMKRWKEEKERDGPNSRMKGLKEILELEYQRYLKLCYWTYEKPLTYTKWLYKDISEASK